MNVNEFAYHLGIILGSIQTPQISTYLKEKGLSKNDINQTESCLEKIAEAFYKK